MSRSMHRRSLAMRVLCTYVMLVVLISFAGAGYANPGSSADAGTSVESTLTPPADAGGDDGADATEPVDEPLPPAEEPVAEEPPVEEPPTGEPPALEPPAEYAEKLADEGVAVTAEMPVADSPVAGVAEAAAPVTNPTASTAHGIVPTYVEGNPVCADYFDFKIDASDIANEEFFTDSEGHTLPGGASITLSSSSDSMFNFSASGVLIHGVYVKAANGAYLYCYDPAGISADQLLYTVQKVGGGYFAISHITFCYSQTPSTGHIIVRKYHDVNGNNSWDGGEGWLEDFTFHLESGESETGPWTHVDRLTTVGSNGHADFGNMVAGWYRITEELSPVQIAAGWACTGENPRIFYHTGEENGNLADEEVKWFGNRIETHEKLFKLTYEGSAPAGTTYLARFTVDDEPYEVALTGASSPYWSAPLDLRAGAVIGNVSWFAVWTPEGGSPVEIMLGRTPGETLRCDTTNRFTYGNQLDGYKYEDLDADGVKDSGEPGLEDWEIGIARWTDGQWVPYGTRTTDSNGYYKFYSPLPGTYRVSETMKTDFDWTRSMPVAEYYEITFDMLDNTTGAGVACVGERLHRDFMNWAPASITGTKFNDLNVNHEKDPDEPGLEGWIIYVDYDGDGVHDPGEPYDTSDANGDWEITGVTPGTYTVREVLAGNWFQSVGTYVVQFQSRGEYGLEIPYDFGNWTTASKAGMKFEDLNADGVKDAGEPGMSGWTVFVDYNGNGTLDAGEPSTVTGANGAYFIPNITPGTYNVYEIMQAGWTQSYPAEGHYSVDFTSSLEDTGNDFGNWYPAEIVGKKFNDLDLDGVFDEGVESGLSGWTIYVDYDGDGVLDAGEPTTVTAGDGSYSITGVTPGTYWVREVDQAGWTQSRGDFQVTFESRGSYGEEGEYDFGNWTTTSLGGYKFEDKDADGAWDAGEPVIPGWTVYLTGTSFLGDPVSLSTVTNGSGHYEFTNLVPGTYVVSEQIPTDWFQSYPASGYYDVTLYSGVVPEASMDFGNWTPADPHGYKIEDLNANGVIDDLEPGISGWTIYLDGTTGWGDPVHLTTVTAGDGYWHFPTVPPGSYVISEGSQSGWTQSFPTSPGTHSLVLGSGDNPEESYDFANWTTATKFGTKFFDADGDGLPREEGEIGLPGWTVYVDYNYSGALDVGEPFAVTQASGAYMIDGIIPGTYPVREVNDLDNWRQTYPASFFYVEQFTSGSVHEGNDFGNTMEVVKSFELTFLNDAPADTTFTVTFTTEYVDEGPSPIDLPSDVIPASSALVIENHELTLAPAGGGVFTAEMEMWPQTLITNVEWWAEWMGEKIKLGDGAAEERIDGPMLNEFEYDADVFGHKWNDTDPDPLQTGDGVWEQDEPAIPGWTIELYRLNQQQQWVLYDTTLTDQDGMYAFADVLPGTYCVGEVIPSIDGIPQWDQSAGPREIGEGAFPVGDGVSEGPVDFGNFQPLPFTLDISLLKAVSTSVASPGDLLTYTLTYEMQDGSLAGADPFSIVDDYDETYLTPVDVNGGVVADGKITWNLQGPLANQAPESFSYTMRVASTMPTGTTNIDNVAVVYLDGDGDPSNNTDNERVSVTVGDGEPFLPFTGGEALILLLAVIAAAGLGVTFRRIGRHAA